MVHLTAGRSGTIVTWSFFIDHTCNAKAWVSGPLFQIRRRTPTPRFAAPAEAPRGFCSGAADHNGGHQDYSRELQAPATKRQMREQWSALRNYARRNFTTDPDKAIAILRARCMSMPHACQPQTYSNAHCNMCLCTLDSIINVQHINMLLSIPC